MAIDFSLSPELEELRARIADFVDAEVRPVEGHIDAERLEETDRNVYVTALLGMRKRAREENLWLPHMPTEWGGMGLGHVEMAMVQAEAAKTRFGSWVLNCQAPTRATCTRCCTGALTTRSSATWHRCARAEPSRASP